MLFFAIFLFVVCIGIPVEAWRHVLHVAVAIEDELLLLLLLLLLLEGVGLGLCLCLSLSLSLALRLLGSRLEHVPIEIDLDPWVLVLQAVQ